MDFWTDLLIDFWRVFGRGLGAVLALKINEKSIKKLSNILIDFLQLFQRKCLLNGRPGDHQNRYISCTFRDPVPGTPLGKQMEPISLKMEPKWEQNGAQIEQNGAKLETIHKKAYQTPIRFVCLFLYLFVQCLLAKIMGGFS